MLGLKPAILFLYFLCLLSFCFSFLTSLWAAWALGIPPDLLVQSPGVLSQRSLPVPPCTSVASDPLGPELPAGVRQGDLAATEMPSPSPQRCHCCKCFSTERRGQRFGHLHLGHRACLRNSRESGPSVGFAPIFASCRILSSSKARPFSRSHFLCVETVQQPRAARNN